MARVKGCTKSVVERMTPVGRPRKIWRDSVYRLESTHINPQDAPDCTNGRKTFGRKTNPEVPGNAAIKRIGFQLVKSILHLATTKKYQKFV